MCSNQTTMIGTDKIILYLITLNESKHVYWLLHELVFF